MKPYKIGGTIADNVLISGLGAYNENIVSFYHQSASNYISFASETSDKGLHPAQKPIKLMKFLIELVSLEGQTILDPFAGSGSTLVACDELNRKYIGMESRKEYYNIAYERLQACELKLAL